MKKGIHYISGSSPRQMCWPASSWRFSQVIIKALCDLDCVCDLKCYEPDGSMSGDTWRAATELPKYGSPLRADNVQYHVYLSLVNIYLSTAEGRHRLWNCVPIASGLPKYVVLLHCPVVSPLIPREIHCTLHCNLD